MFNSVFFLYLTFFISYFIIHSLLASLAFKAWFSKKFPKINGYYRLIFNIVSVILFIPLLALTIIFPGDSIWQWTGVEAWFANSIAVFALIAFYLSLSDYDMTEFLGLYPFKKNTGPCVTKSQGQFQEHFCLGRFHLYVRHPWYFFLLLLIWTRDMTTYQLMVAILLTLYLVVGSYLEEKKMIIYFGKGYQMYRKKVPGLIPLPWKYLTRSEADLLLQKSSC
jgi:protein-S-isoprenylcysteine O-methyltransferase Ste14